MSQDIGAATAESPAAAGRKRFRPSLASYCAVLVICRSATRLSRRELGQRTGLPDSTISYRAADERHGLCDIRQLLQLADSVQVPRPALLPVILGQPQALSDLMAGLAAAPSMGGADRG